MLMISNVSESLGNSLKESFLKIGYGAMRLEDKNLFVSYLAQLDNVPLTHITEGYLFETLKSQKINELSLKCEEAIQGGFLSVNGNFYRTNRDDQINMIGQKDLLDSRQDIETVMWKTENSGYLSHTKNDWLNNVYYFGLDFKANQLFRYNHLKQLVLTASNEEEVLGVNWANNTPFDTGVIAVDSVE